MPPSPRSGGYLREAVKRRVYAATHASAKHNVLEVMRNTVQVLLTMEVRGCRLAVHSCNHHRGRMMNATRCVLQSRARTHRTTNVAFFWEDQKIRTVSKRAAKRHPHVAVSFVGGSSSRHSGAAARNETPWRNSGGDVLGDWNAFIGCFPRTHSSKSPGNIWSIFMEIMVEMSRNMNDTIDS